MNIFAITILVYDVLSKYYRRLCVMTTCLVLPWLVLN